MGSPWALVGALGPLWAPLGPFWAPLGLLWAPLGLLWAPLGPLWAPLGPVWAPLGPPRGPVTRSPHSRFQFKPEPLPHAYILRYMYVLICNIRALYSVHMLCLPRKDNWCPPGPWLFYLEGAASSISTAHGHAGDQFTLRCANLSFNFSTQLRGRREGEGGKAAVPVERGDA